MQINRCCIHILTRCQGEKGSLSLRWRHEHTQGEEGTGRDWKEGAGEGVAVGLCWALPPWGGGSRRGKAHGVWMLNPRAFSMHPFLDAPASLHQQLMPLRRAKSQQGRAWGLGKEAAPRRGLEKLEVALSWAGKGGNAVGSEAGVRKESGWQQGQWPWDLVVSGEMVLCGIQEGCWMPHPWKHPGSGWTRL